MTKTSAAELSERVKQLLARAAETADRAEKRMLAARAFLLAQHAEAVQRAAYNSKQSTAALDPNFKIVTESLVRRFLEELYTETDGKMRELYRNIAVREERWYGARQERLKLLMRLLRDCDGRISRVAEHLSSTTTGGTECLMDNLLDTQRFLLESFCNELSREI